MLKYLGKPAITFAEFPDEISLCYNITNCPCHCVGCSESELAQDIGVELTLEVISKDLQSNPGATLVGFMGGDADHEGLYNLVKAIKAKFDRLRVGFYSGFDFIDLKLLEVVDYYKIGQWRMPTGPVDTWKNQTAGPITLPISNQLMFKVSGGKLINITEEFRKVPINNWEMAVIK